MAVICLSLCAAAVLCGCSGKRDAIGEERAIELAAEHRGVGAEDCSILGVELDDGKYEVELVCDNTKYEIEIDAYTGKAVTTDVKYNIDVSDTDNKVTDGGSADTTVTEETTAKAPDGIITVERAKEIAINCFSLNADECSFVRAELDGAEYDVEFICNGKEYDVEIDARTGNVLETDVESVYD